MQPPERPAAGRTRLTAHAPRANRRGRAIGAGAVVLLAAAAVLTAFAPAPAGGLGTAADQGPAATLRLGYFANVTHAPALVADANGYLDDALGADGTTLETQIFAAGPAAIEALNSGAIDAAYLGPSPALNSYLSSGGTSLRIIAGAASGGASLVTTKQITQVSQLAGTELATPQYGGTQDVALRSFLRDQGLSDAVTVTPSSNGTVPQLFARGSVDGAWLPEPHASLLVEKYGAHRLVDEADLWPGGRFPTTVLVASQEFIAKHPDTVRELVQANAQAVRWLNAAGQRETLDTIQSALAALGSGTLPAAVISSALEQVSFDTTPLAGTFATLVNHAATVGIGERGSLEGLVDDSFTAKAER